MALHIDNSNPQTLKIRFVWDARRPTGQVSVVGTFNNWTPGLDELLPNGDGTRSVTLGLPYGERIVFRYLDSAGHWFDEPDADEITASGSIVRPIHAPHGD